LTQQQETEGVWFHEPESDNGEVGDLEVQRFNEDNSNDEFDQLALTVDGDLGFATLTYSGSIMERDVEYNNDYSDYSQDNPFVAAYACGYYDSGPITSRCTSGNVFYEEENEYERNTHELRLQSQGDDALQYIVGFFYEESTHEYRQEWLIPGMAEGVGYNNLDKDNLWYLTDQKREDEQTALFGEVSYDLSDQLTATIGARFFENESSLKGVTAYGITANDNNFPRLDVDSTADDNDSIFKVNLSYTIDDNKNVYFTWSEGYRAGGLNRDETLGVVPLEYDPDFLTNWEFGWKTTWMDQRLRWNGAVYFMEWEDLQITKFDSDIFDSPVGLTINAGEAEITGLESDLTFIPAEGWTLSGAFAYNQAELSKDFTVGSVLLPDGTDLPHVPELKYNLTGRYEFGLGEFDAFGQLVYAYVDDSYSDLFVADREEQDSYDNVNFTAGLSKDSWGIDLYVNNLTDERAEISRSTQPYGNYITTNRPRTVGIKYRMRF
jgi:outer membrane receptor protein involved in Fe transport